MLPFCWAARPWQQEDAARPMQTRSDCHTTSQFCVSETPIKHTRVKTRGS